MNMQLPNHTNTNRNHVRIGSMDEICITYYHSPNFQGLANSTKATYAGIIERFRKQYGDKKLCDLKRKHVQAIIGSMHDRPHAANNLLSILNIILDFAVDIEILQDNPARPIKCYPKKTAGFHTWTDAEITQYMACHAPSTRPGIAIALLLYTAQRRSDVIKMGWKHIREGYLFVRQQKTGNEVEIPLHGALKTALKYTKASNSTFLTTSYGNPFTPEGFGNWFRDQCHQAGLSGCTAHGLRKAAARRLAEAGATANEIIAITGHSNITEVTVYTREAENRRLAMQGMNKVADVFQD